jgi:hypothetical protein
MSSGRVITLLAAAAPGALSRPSASPPTVLASEATCFSYDKSTFLSLIFDGDTF